MQLYETFGLFRIYHSADIGNMFMPKLAEYGKTDIQRPGSALQAAVGDSRQPVFRLVSYPSGSERTVG